MDGGPETVVRELDAVKPTRAWTVRENGIYFYRDSPGAKPLVEFFDFATRKITAVAMPERPPLRTSPGIDVSPDGRTLLYTQTDQKIEGLMLLENFR